MADLQQRELLLLLTSISDQASEAAPHAGAGALRELQQGQYTQALRRCLAALAPSSPAEYPESSPDWFDAAAAAAQRHLGPGAPPAPAAAEQLLQAAVAALFLFVQSNQTGPIVALPPCPFDLLAGGGASAAPAASVGFGEDSACPGDRWAAAQLSESGEDLIGLIAYPQYLLLARTVLLAPLPASGGAEEGDRGSSPSADAEPWPCAALPSWRWWAARCLLLQQRLLAGRSAKLRGLLLGLTAAVLGSYAPPGVEAEVGPAPGAATRRQLASVALLEAAMMETAYGDTSAARAHLQRSSDVLGLQVELTGVMGKRTVHQREAKAQLVVRVQRDPALPQLPEPPAPRAQELDAWLGGEDHISKDLLALKEDLEPDVLQRPEYEGEGGSGTAGGTACGTTEGTAEEEHASGSSGGVPTDLTSTEQALLLGLCTQLKKGTAADGLQPWEMAAYVDAGERQGRSQALLRAAVRLQGCRLEKSRARTRDRALLAVEQLVGCLEAGGGPPPQERVRYAFAVWFPLRVSLRKELGEWLVARGVVGAALELFEALELWDSLIVCYRLLEKKVQAEELIRRRLEATPGDARLWCSLGDLTLQAAHYEEAWERSGRRSARAQRSLARAAQGAGDHAAAAGHWEAALALNPLHPEGWFCLGYCGIKTRDSARALQAFTRCTQLQPDNGEAWNNLAAVHMHRAAWPQAFAALSEAVKLKRESWQTWENYGQVAATVGQWQAAARGMQTVLALSQGQRLDLATLDALVGEVERAAGADAAAGAGGEGAPGAAAEPLPGDEPDEAAEEAAEDAASLALAASLSALGVAGGDAGPESPSRAAAAAVAAAAQVDADVRGSAMTRQAVGNLLKQIAAGASGDSAFWELYARYYAATGHPEPAQECLLKRVRALQGGEWQKDAASFATYAGAAVRLCRAYIQSAAGGKGQRELSSARMLLRGLLKQAQERHEGHELYARAREALAEVEAAASS